MLFKFVESQGVELSFSERIAPAKGLSHGLQPNCIVSCDTTTTTTALLSKFRTDLTPAQGEIVDAFKQQCPGFAVMRKLVLSFRSLLCVGKRAALRRWMKRAQKTGIHALTRFV